MEVASGFVRNAVVTGVDSCFVEGGRVFWISTKSSSSSAVDAEPWDGPGVSGKEFSDHCPSGSIVTCSTLRGVDRRMSSTYLIPNQQRPEDMTNPTY